MSDSEIKIRLYGQSDHEAVVALWSDRLNLSRVHNDPALSLDRKVVYQPELFFVAEVDGCVVGTVMGGYDGHRGWLYSVAVNKAFEGRGIASALVDHTLNKLRELGCVKVNLQVMAENSSGIAFWESQGWKIEERVSMGKVL